jgi:arginine repressor
VKFRKGTITQEELSKDIQTLNASQQVAYGEYKYTYTVATESK